MTASELVSGFASDEGLDVFCGLYTKTLSWSDTSEARLLPCALGFDSCDDVFDRAQSLTNVHEV